MNGYEGYNSTPSSPTKYTINRMESNNRRGRWIVSKLCIFLTAVVILVALIAVFLCIYYLHPRKCNLMHSVLPNNGNAKYQTDLPIAFLTPNLDLSNDQFNINIVTDNDFYTTTEDMFTTTELYMEKNLIKNRLPRSVVPLDYRLKIIPVFEDIKMITYGDLNITLKCLYVTNQIIMNAKNLDIDPKGLQLFHGDSLYKLNIIQSLEVDSNNEQIVINLNSNLKLNETYIISIKYTGQIRDIPNGLYRSYFIDSESSSKRWMINTLFSPAYARYVYPSFDEPSFKAKFTFSIGRSADMMTLSNMKISSSEPIHNLDGWIWDHYYETPIMSTYLTAFLVSPTTMLMRNKAENVSNPEISLWARPDGAYQTEIALSLSENILTFFEKYFDIKFPLSKIDIVGVPAHDYNAMENWGLIIFREGALLVDQGNSIRIQQSLALMIAHEFAHQWFGNIVTPLWWDDLWLKEGFSAYFQCLAVDQIKPKWNVFDIFVLNEMDSAFQKDSLLSSPPVSRIVNKPNKEMFDVISYHKGSAIIRMMANFVGSVPLKLGLKTYLKKYAYANADQNDLWDCLSREGYRFSKNQTTNLSTIMNSWISQPGYPVINVYRNYDHGTAEIVQKRFLLNGDKNNNTQLWWVPISYTTQDEKIFNDTSPKIWLAEEKQGYLTNLPSKNKWILLNLKSTGFYRVNYDKDNWIMLINDFASLSPIAKAQVISDALNLARGGELDYDIALSLANQLNHEVGFLPWHAAIHSFLYIRNSLIKMPAYGFFQQYINTMLGKAYASILIEDTIPWIVSSDPMQQLHAENIIGMACLFGHRHCITNAQQLFFYWQKAPDDGNIIPEAIRPIIYCTSVREGGKEEWEFAFYKFRQAAIKGARFGPEQASLIMAMGCTSEQWLLTKSLSLINQPDSGLTKEEGIQLFKSVASNSLGHGIAVSFVRSQWKELIKYYNTPSVIYEMVNNIVNYMNTPYDLKELKTLVADIMNYTKEESSTLNQAIETVENNVYWMEHSYLIVDDYLRLILSSFE